MSFSHFYFYHKHTCFSSWASWDHQFAICDWLKVAFSRNWAQNGNESLDHLMSLIMRDGFLQVSQVSSSHGFKLQTLVPGPAASPCALVWRSPSSLWSQKRWGRASSWEMEHTRNREEEALLDTMLIHGEGDTLKYSILQYTYFLTCRVVTSSSY